MGGGRRRGCHSNVLFCAGVEGAVRVICLRFQKRKKGGWEGGWKKGEGV